MEAVLAEAASTVVVVFMEVSLAVGSAEEDFADVGLDDMALGPITTDTFTADTRTAITTRTAAATWSVAA